MLVTVHLPLRDQAGLDALLRRQGDTSSSDYHRFLTPQAFRAAYAPSAADLAAAAAALQSAGFVTHVTSQSVLADGPQALVEHTFGVQLRRTAASGRTALSADRAPTLPSAIAKTGATVAFSPFVRHVHSKRVAQAPVPDNRYSAVGPYWFTDLKQAYGYPSYQTANGAGRTIGIVIDSDVLDSDTAAYFGHEHLAPPPVVRRPVNGGPSSAFDVNNPSSDEASLDVQQSLGSAPGAHVLLYDIPDLSDTNVLAAYQATVDDNRADIVSSSFGLCELYYTARYNGGTDYTPILQAFHDVFRQGNAQGITFVASSGDNGAYDCLNLAETRFIKGVENPADDPDVTGVGGTNLVTSSVAGSRRSTYVSENAFFDRFDPAQGALPNEIWGSGGGVSEIFEKPWYQELVPTRAPTRTVPDIAMHMGGCPIGSVTPCADERSSVLTFIGGGAYELIGTSASAPEFAGLLAVQEQTLGSRVGNANGDIYLLAATAGAATYRHPPGDNGYKTRDDYDYVLGNGTPYAAVFALQPLAPRAGDPWSPSNP